MSVGSFSQYRYTTDTLPIPYRYPTDNSPIQCLQTTDAITTDCRSICRPTCRPTHDRQSGDTRPNLDRHSGRFVNQQSTEISADTSIDTPHKTHDPINLLWDSLLSKLQCLAICKGEMYAALLQLGRPWVLFFLKKGHQWYSCCYLFLPLNSESHKIFNQEEEWCCTFRMAQ